MKFNKTVIGVVLFIILLIAAGYSARSEAGDGATISLGQTVINSSSRIGEIGYEYNNWELNATLIEAGDTKNGVQDQVELYSLSYLTKPKWGYKNIDPYFRLGVSHNSGMKLIGDTNFRLGIGIDFHEVWRLEFSHHSSAGIHNPNTGLDYITITYKAPPVW